MLKGQLGNLTLALTAILGLSAPATLAAHDYDRADRHYADSRYRYTSDRAQKMYERQLRKEQKEERKRWEREQRMRNRNRYEYGPSYDYRNPSGTYNRSYGYYDQYGYWHQR